MSLLCKLFGHKSYHHPSGDITLPCTCIRCGVVSEGLKRPTPPMPEVKPTRETPVDVDLILLKEQISLIKDEIYFCKENIKAMMEDEDNYHLVSYQVDRLERVLVWLGGEDGYE